MGRKDPTFTNNDLLRLYCRNLDPSERYLVLKAFNDFLTKGIRICKNDPEKRIDPCAWIAVLDKVVSESKDIGDLVAKIVIMLATLEAAISVLSWAGPAARVLKIVQVVIAYLISVLTFVAGLLWLVGELRPLVSFLRAFFCTGEQPLPLNKPPNIDLPENPKRRMDEIIEWIESIFSVMSEDELNELPDDIFTGP